MSLTVVMSAEEVTAFLDEVFQQETAGRGRFVVTQMQPGETEVRFATNERHLRPGGTVSGPTMFAMADVCAYAVVLGHVGPKALAVTTNASFDFMRKPSGQADLIAIGRLLKLGRVLAVGDVLIYSEGDERPVARSTMTYSIPPRG